MLRHYLTHHAGEPSASFVGMVPSHGAAEATWATLVKAIDTGVPAVGQRLRLTAPGAAAISGTVLSIDRLSTGIGVTVHVDKPVPGIARLYAMDCGGMQMASLQAFYYGARAESAAHERDRWREWLGALFQPSTEAQKSG